MTECKGHACSGMRADAKSDESLQIPYFNQKICCERREPAETLQISDFSHGYDISRKGPERTTVWTTLLRACDIRLNNRKLHERLLWDLLSRSKRGVHVIFSPNMSSSKADGRPDLRVPHIFVTRVPGTHSSGVSPI